MRKGWCCLQHKNSGGPFYIPSAQLVPGNNVFLSRVNRLEKDASTA